MEQHSTPFEALKRAVDIAGGQRATSRICGTSQTAVWKWLQSPKGIPAEYVLRVEAATGVSRHALRPDIYPHDAASPSVKPGGIVSPAAPVVACDRGGVLQPARAARCAGRNAA